MSTQLSVNINKIALIRNSREGNNPDLVKQALKCIKFGAQGITVHPRPDQRHIRAQDISALKKITNEKDVEFNIEGNPFAGPLKSERNDVSDYPGFIELVEKNTPEQCTLVPDTQAQLTSDHGFNLKKDADKLAPIITRLKKLGTRVSLFMDPDIEQIKLAKDIGADRIELYTGPFAHTIEQQENNVDLFNAYKEAGELAHNIGLGLNAGHDLNLSNIPTLKSLLPHLEEVSIGHALIIDALEFGLESCIQKYLSSLK